MTDATETEDLQLDTLESKGLIRLAAFQPELEYLFRHALVQDTAYESLLKQERRSLHRLVGDALEKLYPERRGDLAAVLAMHFEQAGDADRAIEYLIEAARFAVDRNAITEAYDLYGRAAAALPPVDPADVDALRRRVHIQLGRVKAGFSFMTEREGITSLEAIVDDARAIGDQRLEAEVLINLALLLQFSGERPESSERLRGTLERVSEIATGLGDPLIAALPQGTVGLFEVFSGKLHEGVSKLRAVAPLLREKRDFVGSSFALVALAIGLARLGKFDEAEKAAADAQQIAANGDLIARLDSMIGLSTVRSIRGDLDGAVPLARQCTNMAEETGATACVVASNYILGDAYTRQGDFESAKIVFERGAEVANHVEQRIFRALISAASRTNAANMGDFGPNTGSFEDALAESRRFGDRWGEATVVWNRAETEAKKPADERDTAQMRSDFAAAAAAFEDMGGRPYLARVLRAAGRAERGLGDAPSGTEKLRRAIALFDELGITREADELRAEVGE